MTVIQTIVGGGGGSGQVIDATAPLYTVPSTSPTSGQCVLYIEKPEDIGYPEISIEGRVLKTYGCLPQSRPSAVSTEATTALIANVKSGLENLLPDLPDGQYRILTTGCGNVANYATMPYWTLDVSGGVYTLTYSGTNIMFYHNNYRAIRLISISKMPVTP